MTLRLRSLLFVVAGAILTGIEAYGCYEYLVSQLGHVSYLVVLGCAVTIFAALIPMGVELCWRERRWLLAIVVALAFIPASATIFLAAVERTGGAKDALVAHQREAIVRIAAAERAERDAKADAERDEAAAVAECASGRKAKCLGLEARADAARARLEDARKALVNAGALPVDPQARRVAAMLNVTEAQVQLYGPMVLPVTGSLLGVLFLAIGGTMERKRPPAAKSGAAAAQSTPKDASPVAEPAPVADIAKARQERNEGNVAKFMVAKMPADAGAAAEIADVYASYKGWCIAGGLAPVDAARFAEAFRVICRKANIKTRREADGRFFCVGRRLSA